jgi:hypothetical protein
MYFTPTPATYSLLRKKGKFKLSQVIFQYSQILMEN